MRTVSLSSKITVYSLHASEVQGKQLLAGSRSPGLVPATSARLLLAEVSELVVREMQNFNPQDV
jgi:hypothetical protein